MVEALVQVRRHKRLVEELDSQLQLLGAVTSSGAIMTLPAATSDLHDWIADERKFVGVQHDDWVQVLDDFSESVADAGPRLADVVAGTVASILAALPNLIVATAVLDGSVNSMMDEVVRAGVLTLTKQLGVELQSDDAIVAAWRDLVRSCEKENRSVEEVSCRRDTLWAVAESRDLRVGQHGVLRDAAAVLTDEPFAVQRELDLAEGIEDGPDRFSSHSVPTGVDMRQRLALCEQLLRRPPVSGDCIVWLRLEPTLMPDSDITHGPVTFYNASILSSAVGHPEDENLFTVAPTEILNPPDEPPILIGGEPEWEDNWHMTYARVLLPNTVLHHAEQKARTLVEALKAVNHANKDTWCILNGSIIFLDDQRVVPWSWGPKSDEPEPFRSHSDRMSREITRMNTTQQSLDTQSVHELRDAIGMSTAIRSALDESPEATVMTAVRVIEHVNAWVTGGVKNWADFVCRHFKTAQSRVRIVDFIGQYTMAAVESTPRPLPPTAQLDELNALKSSMFSTVWPGHRIFHTRKAADHIGTLSAIYADHPLGRGLGETSKFLSSAANMQARIDLHARRFDRQLRRLKRLRNSAIHGGPISEAACISVQAFANNLAHQCINEVIRALLVGADIPSHMEGFRTDHVSRYERISTTADIDALFVESEP